MCLTSSYVLPQKLYRYLIQVQGCFWVKLKMSQISESHLYFINGFGYFTNVVIKKNRDGGLIIPVV